ncbi:MAG: trypsin-like peptidase domain-containing protein [Acidimicrobiales bacterium]
MRLRRAAAMPFLAVLLVLPATGPERHVEPAGGASLVNHRTEQNRPPASGVLSGVGQLLRQLGLGYDPPSVPLPGSSTRAPSADMVSRVSASTVKVSGVACGAQVAGSGFSAAADTIVTNAHVVAGVRAPQVLGPDGRRLTAQVQVFDPDRDVAVLAVPGLGQQPLAIGSATVGESGGVYGHPQGQIPVEVSPAQVLRRIDVTMTNIYDEGAIQRQVLVLASDLEPGDSGAPVVNNSGKVVGVAFGVSTVQDAIAFAVPGEEVAGALARPRSGAVSTGPCPPR